MGEDTLTINRRINSRLTWRHRLWRPQENYKGHYTTMKSASPSRSPRLAFDKERVTPEDVSLWRLSSECTGETTDTAERYYSEHRTLAYFFAYWPYCTSLVHGRRSDLAIG